MIRISSYILNLVLTPILIFLAVLSLVSTQRCGIEGTGEIMNNVPIYKVLDNFLFHGFAILLLSMICIGLSLLNKRKNWFLVFVQNHILYFQGAVSCLAGVFSFLIFLGGTRTPIDDQIQVYSAALCFNEGNYINLSPGGYVDMYPQQLGYILFMQIVFRVVGSSEFQIIQIINCLLIAGVFFSVCLFLNDLTELLVPRIVGTLLLSCLLPLYLLQTWVYGDIPFFLCAFLFLHFSLKFMREEHRKDGLLCVLAAVLSVLFRKNALILIIAAIMILLILFIVKKRKNYLVLLLCLSVLPLGAVAIIEQYYQRISGYEVTGGIPSVAWITMGTIENGSAPGWFNNYSVPVYYSTGYDREETAKFAFKQLGEQINCFKANPVYALSFWKRKIATQWNDPFYHTNYLITVDQKDVPKGVTAFIQEQESNFLIFLSLLQTIIYLGGALYIFFVSHKGVFYKRLPEVYFVGGFLFSLLWEANSRYVLPYYLIMFPLAAIGWHYGINFSIVLLKRKFYKMKEGKQ